MEKRRPPLEMEGHAVNKSTKYRVRRAVRLAAKIATVVALAWIGFAPGGDVQAAQHTVAHVNSK